MNKFVVFILGAVVIAGIGLASLFSLSPNKNQEFKPVSAAATCTDFDPPDTADTVSYGGATYGLIKKEISISQSKMGEMSQVDSAQGLWIMTSGNWYGQKVPGTDVIYKKIVTPASAGANSKDVWFNVYFKSGATLPDYIKNCKADGGTVTVLQDTTAFPPYGFNKTEITGATDPSIAVAYIYDGNKPAANSITTLSGITQAGTLFVKSKNKSYELKLHLGTIYLIDGEDAYEYMATDTPIPPNVVGDKSLQLKKIQFITTSNVSWWTPVCKPAIYLYPENTQQVNVKVNTKGRLTLTIPNYPENGWTVLANKNGLIESNNNFYPYLYYESEIPDQLVKKPERGYVVNKAELPALFNDLLPKLGLNQKESSEFKEYWEKVLPNSPYYFVGVMDKENIDAIEPILFNPVPDIFIRVRIYFEALDKKISVSPPLITTPKRVGFTAVEWGGAVKTDQEHPFTCSK
jgi:hypothetical protein